MARSSPRWELEAELALQAVSEGGEMTRERPERAVVATKESARDVVTDLDLKIEEHIRRVLAPSGHLVLGEETHREGDAWEPEPGRPWWLVDPIDGTENFVSGMPFYAVSVGLQVDGELVLGAVALPEQRELLFTHGDAGAFLNGRRLKVATTGSLGTSLVAASFSGAKGDPAARRRQFELFGAVNDASRGCLRLGSAAANICFVAAGRLQAAYGARARIWDVAGPLAIARQAGAHALLAREKGSTRVDYIVGAPPVVAEIRRLGEELAVLRFAEGGRP